MADEKDLVLQHLEGISGQLNRMENKIDGGVRKAVIAGGAAGAITGAIAGSLAPELIRAAIDLAKLKLGM